MENQTQRKPRILCLHGFRNSGEILKKLAGRLPQTVLEKLDLVFLDAPFPAEGKSGVEGIYDPPYYEWFQANEVLHLSPIYYCFFFFRSENRVRFSNLQWLFCFRIIPSIRILKNVLHTWKITC